MNRTAALDGAPARVPTTRRTFLTWAWVTLGVTILVIIWGAVVRATGSGAGCGSHWPLCNGDVVPLDPATATVIEYVHRLTSGGVMLLALALLLLARRWYPVGHQVRRWARICFVFMIIEALIGAGIVLLGLVEDNASLARALYVGGHLINTLLLVGAIVVTIWWATRTCDGLRLQPMFGTEARALSVALIALLAVAATGAIVALGDTLFPSESLRAGLRADLDPSSHFLIRLRIWHPVVAVLTAGWLFGLVTRGHMATSTSRLLVAVLVGQLLLGAVNLLLLAPLWLQMAHLLVSNLLWIVVVWAWMDARAAAQVRAGVTSAADGRKGEWSTNAVV